MLDAAGGLARASVLVASLVVAPLPVLMIGACDWFVLARSHWRFRGMRRWLTMMVLNSVMFWASGMFSPVCAFPVVALMLGVAVSSAFFLAFPRKEPEPALRSDGKWQKGPYIDVEVIDSKPENPPDGRKPYLERILRGCRHRDG